LTVHEDRADPVLPADPSPGVLPAGTAHRLGTLEVLAAVLADRTDNFLLLDGDPLPWRVRRAGAAVSSIAARRALAAAAEGLRWSETGWCELALGDRSAVALVADPDLLPELEPVAALAGVALRADSLALRADNLAQRADNLARLAAAAESEVEALRSVATRILRARKLDDALLAVTNETLGLLDSDIAGVLLREGDEIVMRACAGNQLADTGKLRMRRGQGLAGHVFATAQAAKVDDYLRSDVISNDFNYLARAERTRSALGAPLVLDGEVIGVLEVWRRRESTFSPADIRRLVALADLAAIALDNARQHQMSVASKRAAEVAHRALQSQLGKVEQALAGQQELIEAVIGGEQLAGISRIVARRSQCEVVLFDDELEVLVGTEVNAVAALRRLIRDASRRHPSNTTMWTALDHGSAAIRAVRTGDEEIGWVALVGAAAPGDEAIDLAVTQAALTVALHHLEQQAAAKARASMREELLLNLLKGSADERRAAVARARYLQIDLRGDLRICVCTFAGSEAGSGSDGWRPTNPDQLWRKLFHLGEEELARAGVLRLAAANGNGLIALIHPGENADLHAVIASVTEALVAQAPQCRPVWGVSGPHGTAQELDRAHAEAVTASQALRQESGRQVALYEELGVLALLIGGPHGAPLGRFAQDTIGPVLAHDARHGTSLVQTLRTYLDLNCNQKDTAVRLFVHQKTVKYRLETIEKLTALNLHEHADRMRADIALRANDLR
jgi:DNA-binding PucR family transcriptional regulator/putative methionine-R-sulfoxide reductase with GAF domain